jgi:hypothetical protein
MKKVQMTSAELKLTLTHLIKNNKSLQEDGLKPVAISICGGAGLGKTSVVEQLAEELNIKNVEIINLAQLDELGDLVGIPVKEYYMTKITNETQSGKFIEERVINAFIDQGWQLTNNSRMSYSKPAWIAGKGEDGILILDDYTRAAPRFMQAVMEIIDKQRYISWKLPKGWTILLTENPDDGTYNVTDIDAAAKSRYITFDMKWEPNVWAEWAEQAGIDERAINFTLLNGNEIIKEDKPEINPRSLVKFYNSLKTIKDYNANLGLIQNIGEGAVGPEVTTLFTMFINNRLDKMINPSEILDTKKDFETIKDKIKDLIKEGTEYRADIAYVLTTRLINYMIHTVKNTEITSLFIDRVKALVVSNCLGTDLKFVLAKKVINSNNKYNVLMNDESIVNVILE